MDRDAIRYRHMLDAARKILEFTHSRSRAEFDADEQLVLSLTRLLEIIGEAATKVSAEGCITHSAIPWREIVAMRNRLIHANFDMDLDEVWKTVKEDVPILIFQLERIVPPG